MGQYKIKKVDTSKELKEFIRLPERLYQGCPYYVPDMESDIEAIFNPQRNPGLEFSDIQPFIAIDGKGNTVGRIAGIINHHANERWKVNTVRFSMIEFIDDIEVSKALLDAVTQWGKARGMSKIQGPMGISDFDKEGMLVEDFDQTGSEVTIYNPPYYPQHLERLGFQKEVDWIQYRINVPETVPERYAHTARLVKKLYGLEVRKLTRHQVLEEGYGKQIFELLNEAYKPLFGFSDLTDGQARMFLNSYLPFLNLDFVPVIFDPAGKMVGLAITMGSMTEAFQKSHGRLLPFGWFHLLKALKFSHGDHAELLLIAVRPDYQGIGVTALIFEDLIPIYNRMHYTWAETGPQLESNVKELSQWKSMTPKGYKRRRCYSKEITGNKK